MKFSLYKSSRTVILLIIVMASLQYAAAQISPYPPCEGQMTISFNVAYNCTLGTANVLVVPNCGTSPFSYTWSNGQISTNTLLNVGPGTYSVTVVEAGGQSASGSVVVQNAPLVIDPAISIVSSDCNGNVTIKGSASGGSPQYQYTWSTGATTQQTTVTAPGTATGRRWTARRTRATSPPPTTAMMA